MNSPETKAFEEKINTQLQQAKAQLAELEAQAKGKTAQAEIDAIKRLKGQHQEIDRKRQELKTVADARVGQVKAELEEDVADLRTSLADLATKVKKAA
jgi:F0F1-type ATP synthase membrane subunit b/b'